MKMRLGHNQVVVSLTLQEAVRIAQLLYASALASGTPIVDDEPTEAKAEEQGG